MFVANIVCTVEYKYCIADWSDSRKYLGMKYHLLLLCPIFSVVFSPGIIILSNIIRNSGSRVSECMPKMWWWWGHRCWPWSMDWWPICQIYIRSMQWLADMTPRILQFYRSPFLRCDVEDEKQGCHSFACPLKTLRSGNIQFQFGYSAHH